MRRRSWFRSSLISMAVLVPSVLPLGLASPASAQTLGTFAWQIAPYCNVVHLSVAIDGPSLRLTGYDDQCGAARLPAAGTATLRADGLYGFTFAVMTTTGLVSDVAAAISPASLSGPWSDSSGATGTLIFSPSFPTTGIHRPPPRLPGSTLAPGAITAVQIADDAIGAAEIVDGAIGAADIASGAVGVSELANASVTGAKLQLPLTAVTSANAYAFRVTNNAGDVLTGALWGESAGVGRGVVGIGGVGVTGQTVTGSGVIAYSEGSGNALWARSVSGSAALLETASSQNSDDVVVIRGSGTGDLIQASYAGDVQFRLTKDGAVQADGAYTSPAADVAEFIDSVDMLTPGDVVEIDGNEAGRFRRATTASSTAVAGVVTTKPGVLLNATDDRHDVLQGPALALSGRVPVKVSAENGSITPGDLLVASSLAGHAMRAPTVPAAGTVIGKALGVHASGTGIIEMLVMLR